MPTAPVPTTKHTKIVCTVGPACASLPLLCDMLTSGMNIARVNFSHGTHESNLALLETVREASAKTSLPVAVLLDLQGPKVRIGQLPPDGLELKEGETVTLVTGTEKSDPGTIPIPYGNVVDVLQVGDLMLLDDGTKELEVINKEESRITARILLGGTLLSRKGVTIPRASLIKESLTDKDDEDLRFGLQHAIDFVALSFVRDAADVVKLKQKIEQYLPANLPTPRIIVKIEKPEALANFDVILEAADGVMIARGDLGLETPISHVPLRQKEIIHRCLAAAKPVITATEMLGTMQFNPRPTRAEVSDVANAVFDHTDAVMLSGETALGRYPVRAVRMMSDIITTTEASPLYTPPAVATPSPSSPLAIAESVVDLAQALAVKAIVVTTQSGYFARAFARLRSPLPLLALSPSPATCQHLLLSWGVTALHAPTAATPAELLTLARPTLQERHHLAAGDKVLLVVSSSTTAPGSDEHAIHLTAL